MQKKAHIYTSHIEDEEEEEEKFYSEVTLNNFAQDANSTETVKVKHCRTTSIFYEELRTKHFWCAHDTNKHTRITHVRARGARSLVCVHTIHFNSSAFKIFCRHF